MLTNRPFDRDTMTNIGSNREPKKSGIMSSLASAIERGKQTRLRNEARRFGKAGRDSSFPTTSQARASKKVTDPIVSEFQLANMIDAGYEPARRDLSGNIVNPYGSTGLKQYISFPNLEQNQRNEILNKRVQRFMNPQTDDPSLRRGFGSLFGSSEGEPTISGPLRKQIEPMSPIEMGARGIFSLLPGNIFGPIVSMADPGGTTMVPEFSIDPVTRKNLYDPNKDPRNNPQSMVGSMLDFFTGGAGTEALSRISDLLPRSNKQISANTEGPVANPFYPDMRRPVNEPDTRNELLINVSPSEFVSTQETLENFGLGTDLDQIDLIDAGGDLGITDSGIVQIMYPDMGVGGNPAIRTINPITGTQILEDPITGVKTTTSRM